MAGYFLMLKLLWCPYNQKWGRQYGYNKYGVCIIKVVKLGGEGSATERHKVINRPGVAGAVL